MTIPAFRYRVALYLLVGLAALGFSLVFGPWDDVCLAGTYGDGAWNSPCAPSLVLAIWSYGPIALTAMAALAGEVVARRRHQ